MRKASGVNAEEGEFDSIFLVIHLYRDGKLARMKYFELKHLDAALARFEELSADRSKPDHSTTHKIE
ncbi:MAG: hypothetical protein ACI8W3_000475 [Myxococcota bacterium]|jgi:hypothetical protein